jgi:hypothetical protein
VELRYVPTAFRAGLVISGVTLVAWLGMMIAVTRRAATATSPREARPAQTTGATVPRA